MSALVLFISKKMDSKDDLVPFQSLTAIEVRQSISIASSISTLWNPNYAVPNTLWSLSSTNRSPFLDGLLKEIRDVTRRF
ncbi:hypothetical protein F2Q68_00026888 [Brassica cretica]|uniref:Uncharacterized protein n=1 Tax=Brassica cretica TaxID=69181 RepID=A0A8S9I8B0_BRACR|nr:hypothetical protein F2Q68_00026888 [Brassica cretica]